MDQDLDGRTAGELRAEVVRLRAGIRAHRDSSGQELCWHHPQLWGLLPEKIAPDVAVPPWPRFLQGCLRYRESLDRELPNARLSDEAFGQAPSGLLPFVPSGPSFDGSRAFFRELGFREEWSAGGYAGFQHGAARFILQELDNEAFASNLMIRIDVGDLDAWWTRTSAKQLEARFPGVRAKPPTEFPWGREVHLIDLAGVCWHVGSS
jgi:hypothetical protein